MNEFVTPMTDSFPPERSPVPMGDEVPVVAPEPTPQPQLAAVDPVRAAAGRRGGHRVHQLAELGRKFEEEHGLSPGRQRLKQLIQLGRRYEVEHGLAAPKARRRKRGDAWAEFVAALARVVKPAHRPAVEQLAQSPRPGPRAAA